MSAYCRQSNDGTVCLRHLKYWPCPVAELAIQLRAAAVELAGDPECAIATREALGHIKRSIELADAIAQNGIASPTGAIQP